MKYLQDSEGQTITLPEDVEIFKRVVSFIGFEIAGDYSTDFDIPNDSDTRAKLGFYGLNQVDKLIQKPFHFYIDGNKIADGRVFVRGVADTIDCFFISGNGNWMNQIKGDLKDIDFSAYNTDFDAATIVNRFGATEGVIFPVMDWVYNYRKLTNVFQAQAITGVSIDSFYDFYPCFHAKTILKEIARTYGFILSGNLFDDPVYNDLVITAEQIQSAAYVGAISNQVSGTQRMDGTFENVSFPSDFKLSFQSGTSYFDDTNDRLVFPFTGSVTLTYSLSRPGFSQINSVRLKKNGVTVSETELPETDSILTINGAASIEVIPGDYVELWASGDFGTATTGNVVVNVTAYLNGTITLDGVSVGAILPDLGQFDFIKYIAQRFNCLLEFEELTQTLSFTLLDSVREESAVDMSDRLVSYEQIPASGYAEKNFIRTREAQELINYKTDTLNYGDAVIESDGDGDQDVIDTPLSPAETFQNIQLQWLLTSVPLVRLEDADDGVEYVNVQDPTGISGKAEFVNAQVFDGYPVNSVIRIQSDSGEYTGFAVVEEADTTGLIIIGGIFGSTDTGKIYKQKIVFPYCGSRELIVCRNIDLQSINIGSQAYGSINLKIMDADTTIPVDVIAWAFHAKPNIGTDLDNFRIGLNYGPVTNTGNIPFGILYHKNLKKIVRGSRLPCEMMFTLRQYNDLSFRKMVFLHTADFTGYFLIDSVQGFSDPNTPVAMELIYMGNG